MGFSYHRLLDGLLDRLLDRLLDGLPHGGKFACFILLPNQTKRYEKGEKNLCITNLICAMEH
jgi:hypothetical protein